MVFFCDVLETDFGEIFLKKFFLLLLKSIENYVQKTVSIHMPIDDQMVLLGETSPTSYLPYGQDNTAPCG